MSFPPGFAWGAATSAYQIEGASAAEGKGISVWDHFCRRPGAVWQGQSGDTACDHYRRSDEDVRLMKEIGLKAYRFSLSWPRIFPEGTGALNQRGLDFYDRLVDSLLENGIEPWVTLFHWDYPLTLHQHRGGWLNPDSPSWFAEYAQAAAGRLSDRAAHWFTINEPQVLLDHGYLKGIHAPGCRLSLGQVLQIGHHLLLAHGRAAQAIRAAAGTPLKIGWAPVGSARIPAAETPEDIEAARRSTFSVDTDEAASSVWNCAWWMDPVFLGHYPEKALKGYGRNAPKINPGDMAAIHQPLDFLGANIYTGSTFRAGAAGRPEYVPPPLGAPLNTYGWNITPDILYWAGRFYYERYQKPIVVTENGIPIVDMVFRDGCVHDPQRCEYMDTYLAGVGRALAEGIPFTGYFYWSLMDNFEWQEGCKQRFGLIYVDYPTQRRILKDSARHYAAIIARNGLK